MEDDWESPTLGAWGLGWEVWCDGQEITQFTYFQQCGGFDCKPVAAELTYGLERLATYIQGVESVFDLEWVKGVKYREIFHANPKTPKPRGKCRKILIVKMKGVHILCILGTATAQEVDPCPLSPGIVMGRILRGGPRHLLDLPSWQVLLVRAANEV